MVYRTFGKQRRKSLGQADHAQLVWLTTASLGTAAILEGSDLNLSKQNARKEQEALRRRTTTNSVHRFLCDLKSCSNSRDLEVGRQIHAKVLESGNDQNVHITTALVKMYAKCGSMVQARQVFDSIRQPDVVSWNTLILGYAENGEGLIALDLFLTMKSHRCPANSITYVAVLKACASVAQNEVGNGRLECLKRGKQIHAEIGCHINLYVQNALMDMYAKCGSVVESRHVFDSIRHPDVVSWTTLLMGYAENGEGLTALDLFSSMKLHGCAPNCITYVAALRSCTSLVQKDVSARLECLERGKEIHAQVGRNLNLYVQNTLIDMYAKCGCMVDARQVFDSIRSPDVISWNVLLLGYAENGEGLTALELFSTMKLRGYAPDYITYVAVIKTCTYLAQKDDGIGRAKCLEQGKQIHLEIGRQQDLCIQTALVDMYAKCGVMVDARQIFDSIRQPDVVSWTSLILGYAENGEGLAALDMFFKMKSHGCTPDCIAYVAVLKACGSLGALEYGRSVHAEVTEFNRTLVTCLVDFYAKCGSLTEAQAVFDSHSKTRDSATWNSLLAGYSSFGEADSVFRLFKTMQETGFEPDGLTYLCILMCCSHAGLVEKARNFFGMMSAKHRLAPTVKHYNCMVDVLGRANKLDDAIAMLMGMPCRPNAATWMTILGACRKWKNVEIGRLAFHSLVSLDEEDAAPYVVMAQIFASKSMWKDQEMVLEMRRTSRVKPG